jgi:hypothetical protein
MDDLSWLVHPIQYKDKEKEVFWNKKIPKQFLYKKRNSNKNRKRMKGIPTYSYSKHALYAF